MTTATLSRAIAPVRMTNSILRIRLILLSFPKYEFEDALTPEVVTGPGVNFGVTAEEFAQTGHMQTNFATNNYLGEGNSQINVQQDLTNLPGSLVASKITGQIFANTPPEKGTVLVCTSNPEKIIGNTTNVVKVKASEQRLKSTIVDPILNHGEINVGLFGYEITGTNSAVTTLKV